MQKSQLGVGALFKERELWGHRMAGTWAGSQGQWNQNSHNISQAAWGWGWVGGWGSNTWAEFGSATHSLWDLKQVQESLP